MNLLVCQLFCQLFCAIAHQSDSVSAIVSYHTSIWQTYINLSVCQVFLAMYINLMQKFIQIIYYSQKAWEDHYFVLDTKSCRHSGQWESWLCWIGRSFSRCHGHEITSNGILPRVSKLMSERWPESWSKCTEHKLHLITASIDSYQCFKSLNHHDSVIVNRLRIGHTRLTHS